MSLLNLWEEFIMFEKIRKMKNKKGFTLVELIVVLVILAILAALLIPALTGYIDKANEEKVVAECRMVVMAAQVEGTDYYKNGYIDLTAGSENAPKVGNIIPLAEVKSLGTVDTDGYTGIKPTNGKSFFEVTYSTTGQVLGLKYDNGVYFVDYTNGAYTVGKKADNKSLALTSDDIKVSKDGSYTASTFTKPLN